jgi:hypothetical protein
MIPRLFVSKPGSSALNVRKLVNTSELVTIMDTPKAAWAQISA